MNATGHRVIGIDIRDAEVTADLSTAQGRADAVREVQARSHGTLDAIVACAGLAHPSAQTVAVNFFGTTELLDALAPLLAKSQAPRTVIVGSTASLMPNDPTLVEAMLAVDEEAALRRAQVLVDAGGGAEQLIYGSTKRAVSRWARRVCVNTRWAGAGIPLNVVAPGIVRTPVADMVAKEEARAALDEMVPMPLNYYLERAEVAHLLIWLTSPENSHTTGQTIYIDGGSDAVIRGDDVWTRAAA